MEELPSARKALEIGYRTVLSMKVLGLVMEFLEWSNHGMGGLRSIRYGLMIGVWGLRIGGYRLRKRRFSVFGLRNSVCGLKEWRVNVCGLRKWRFSRCGWREWRIGVCKGRSGGLNSIG